MERTTMSVQELSTQMGISLTTSAALRIDDNAVLVRDPAYTRRAAQRQGTFLAWPDGAWRFLFS